MAMQPIHGHAMEGQRSRVYDIWRGMRQRCTNPKASGYLDYGGRGITICTTWQSFANFLTWVASSNYRDNYSIERHDVDGNYEPNNCYWVGNSHQAANKRKRKNQKSKYIGVAPNKNNWQAYIDYEYKRTNLGTYETEEEAAQVRDKFVTDNKLPHKLNF